MREQKGAKKERVVAIDYFRGVCMLIVIFSHGYPFTLPYAYLTGIGNLWTSAAELFFLMSGLTLGVVRGPLVQSDLRATVKKCWRQAAKVYLIYLAVTVLAVVIGRLVTAPATQTLIGISFHGSNASLLWNVANFQFAPGLANFLKFYVIYMLVAPFLLLALFKSRFWWPLIAAASGLVYIICGTYPLHVINQSVYSLFGIWQVYFVMGLILARFRLPVIGWIYGLNRTRRQLFEKSYFAVAGVALATSLVLGYTVFFGARFLHLANEGWLPLKLKGAYLHLMDHAGWFNQWLMNDRMGLLRPLATLLFFGAGYLLYQKYKGWLLPRTGKFVNKIGSDTLWIFAAQSIVIPFLAAVPLKRNFINNSLLTIVLLGAMWAITQRKYWLTRMQESWRSFNQLTKQVAIDPMSALASEDQIED